MLNICKSRIGDGMNRLLRGGLIVKIKNMMSNEDEYLHCIE